MAMKREVSDTHQKALQINLDSSKYGTIAEIGAGQEVAHWFFRVGGAAGTIAKSVSAYDMKFSDSIYGPAPRYVSRERLRTMLDHEYGLLVERLAAQRGAETTFFAFANTVTARSYTRKHDGHGWLGIRFQTRPQENPSQIDVHVHLLGKEYLQDQKTLGVMGVNLIHGAMHLHEDPEALTVSLLDNLHTDLAEVDMIDFSGPSFNGVDNRLMSLKLVQGGLTNAAMFTADGLVVHPADALYKKAILVERSKFRPPTHLTIDMLARARAQFLQEPNVHEEDTLVLMEMTLHNLVEGDVIDPQDFLERAEMLCALGENVLISNYGEYYRLAEYLFRYTQKPIGLAMGVPSLEEIFKEKYYQDLAGGILESFGRLFRNDLRLYVYPSRDPKTGEIITVHNMPITKHLRHLYQYLIENGVIKGLQDINKQYLPIFPHDVLEKIQRRNSSWESMVPAQVARIIKERRLFNYRS